ncbi:hypothetical protein [Plasmodium yoelii yoelii]
MIITN